VIYNFYRPKPPRKGRQEVRRALRVRKDDFLLLHMSNLRPVKRAQDVLRVLAELKDQPRVKLLILAGESFGPFRKAVKRLGIEDRVIVKENVLDIENYLHAADVGLYTSERESFGMGVLETMSFGKPVVATRVGGVTEIMRDGETGFLKRLGDVKSMARAVRTLANDSELAARMGEAARTRAEREFSSQKSVEQYLDLYRRTIRDCPD
jgi:L-malate glycosyltransferase